MLVRSEFMARLGRVSQRWKCDVECVQGKGKVYKCSVRVMVCLQLFRIKKSLAWCFPDAAKVIVVGPKPLSQGNAI